MYITHHFFSLWTQPQIHDTSFPQILRYRSTWRCKKKPGSFLTLQIYLQINHLTEYKTHHFFPQKSKRTPDYTTLFFIKIIELGAFLNSDEVNQPRGPKRTGTLVCSCLCGQWNVQCRPNCIQRSQYLSFARPESWLQQRPENSLSQTLAYKLRQSHCQQLHSLGLQPGTGRQMKHVHPRNRSNIYLPICSLQIR